MYNVIAYFCTCKVIVYTKLGEALHRGMSMDFDNIQNSKTRCLVSFSEKENPLNLCLKAFINNISVYSFYFLSVYILRADVTSQLNSDQQSKWFILP